MKNFAEANVREINGYNAKVDSIEVPEGQAPAKKMPQIGLENFKEFSP